jgi:hypothetical protein
MPETTMAPAHSTKKVGDITLPEGTSAGNGREKRCTYINENYQEFCEKYKELLESIYQVLVRFDLLPGSTLEDRPVLEESFCRLHYIIFGVK